MLPKIAVWWLVLDAVASVRAQGHIPVTGVKVDKGPVPLRQNINDVQNRGGPAWDLLIRSMLDMYAMDPSDERSYFQIAGIHGKPYIEWNKAGPERATGWEGYCPHGEKIFATWHRPYLALYEQELVGHATKLALTYPRNYRNQYKEAAKNLRLPFWDWGAEQAVPPATVQPKVRVKIPDGQQLRSVDVDNPYFTYKYPKAAREGRFGTFDSQPQIYRCQSGSDKYPDSANRNLQGRPYKRWVYDAFTRSSTYDEFTSADGGGIGLEQIHNAIHWDGACRSQFLALDYTAFDPLFMLHHSNVDRLWAYWEAIHPDSPIFEGSYEGFSRFSTRNGTTINPDSPLEPFFQENGAFHTSRSVADLKRFGYSYQGLEYWEKSVDGMKRDATNLINRLYDPDDSAAAGMFSVKDAQTRFFVGIQLDMAQVERPCAVNVYVAGKLAGNMVVMQPAGTGIMRGGFSIDDAVQHAGLQNSSTDKAIQSIQSSLEVGIVKGDGSPIPLSSVPSLKVELEDVTYSPASSRDALPKFGTPKLRPVSVADHFKGPVQ